MRFTDGDVISGRPIGGIVIFAIPANHLGDRSQKVSLTAFSASGRKIASNAWAYYRERPTDQLPEPR